MSKKENIRLDATLKSVISNAVFSAELPNGHRVVVFTDRAKREFMLKRLRPGDRVQVELSPYDMSKGRIIRGDSNYYESTHISKKAL